MRRNWNVIMVYLNIEIVLSDSARLFQFQMRSTKFRIKMVKKTVLTLELKAKTKQNRLENIV